MKIHDFWSGFGRSEPEPSPQETLKETRDMLEQAADEAERIMPGLGPIMKRLAEHSEGLQKAAIDYYEKLRSGAGERYAIERTYEMLTAGARAMEDQFPEYSATFNRIRNNPDD